LKRRIWKVIASASLALTLICGSWSPEAQRVVAIRDFFYVGGKYAGPPDDQVMAGQMYVEVLQPARVTQEYPLVFFHGNWQTATNWMGTPDGRPGWAEYFLAQGYRVHLVDQPARGRSAWHRATNGPLGSPRPALLEERFTAPAAAGRWPQARHHTQWPGQGERKGRRGDPVFDAFYATQVESLTDEVETQTLVQAAGAALLDRIGPAILLTHSQAGTFGWLLADARPQLVKGILAIEPAGPPFQNAVFDEDKARAWGLTDIPLTYDPPLTRARDLKIVRQPTADAPGLARCALQADPARTLPRLRDIPVLIVTTEASYHAVYDHCTAKYLAQAGVKNTFARLELEGIRGNGHMVMLEKNNLVVAAFLQHWISAHIQ
jgi:pimeloyl-ACP methyl ester carboxylesterase